MRHGAVGQAIEPCSAQTGAITIPDVLRARFESPALALLSTVLLAALLCVYLIPQFTLAALIMEQLLGAAPVYQEAAYALQRAVPLLASTGGNPEYILGLMVFAVLVVLYTTFGGFRAVVWTDILQGFVMLAGVLLMLVLALNQVGGLGKASAAMQAMQPPRLGTVSFAVSVARANWRSADRDWHLVQHRRSPLPYR